MKTLLLFSAIFILSFPPITSGQEKFCDESTPICLDQSFTYAAGMMGSAEPGAFYACLSTQPAPAWFHMRFLEPGEITIYMYSAPLVDIDFICWGPFTDPYAPCVAGLTSNKVVDCTYSPNSYEYCDIPNGQTGEYYILMITNYSQQPTQITFSKSAGSGSLDCTIVSAPDLVVTNPEIYPETLFAGDTLSVSSTVVNQGNQDAAVSKLFYYLSSDTIFDGNDTLLGFDYNGVLGAGDTLDHAYSTPLSPGTAPGPWYILFYVDADQQIVESDEENNLNYIGFTVDTATSIDDPGIDKNNYGIRVYPNPANNRLFIDYSETQNSPVEIGIFNILGTKMISTVITDIRPGTISVNCEAWPAGGYLLRIKTHAGTFHLKVLIQ